MKRSSINIEKNTLVIRINKELIFLYQALFVRHPRNLFQFRLFRAFEKHS